METLLSARNLLAKSLKDSDSVRSSLEICSDNLRKADSSLAESTDVLRSLHQRFSTLSTLDLHADHAMGPACAYSSVVLLKRFLLVSDPKNDLQGYLASVCRLEQGLSFLTENCALAIHWLDDVARLLDESSSEDEGYVSSVRRSLAILERLKATEARERHPGGGLCLALDKLECHLGELLLEISPTNVAILESVVERLRLNKRGARVAPLYVNTRVSVARSRLASIWSSVENGEVAQWAKRVEIGVHKVIQLEHDLCRATCDAGGLNGSISMECYAEIVAQSGFLETLVGLGNNVVASKKDAAKLLKLLDLFDALDTLRSDFNRLFGGKECAQVQGLIRELVRRVVEGSVEIFDQLELEVDRAKAYGGTGVPQIVVFVTDYCQLLLSDDKYKPALLQVLSIHQTWHGSHLHAPPPERQSHLNAPSPERLSHLNAPHPERLLKEVVRRIMGALEAKLQKCANRLHDPTLACVFLVENYQYLHHHLQDTELGRLLGEEYRAKMEIYAAANPDQCRTIPSIVLNEDELTLGRRKMRAYT